MHHSNDTWKRQDIEIVESDLVKLVYFAKFSRVNVH